MRNLDPVAELRRVCCAAPSQRQWAFDNGISPQYVNDVLAGRREPGPALLEALGLERVTLYRRVTASAD